MKIRQANKFDIPRLIELMKHYRDCSPLECLKQSNNVEWVEALITHILMGRGVIFVAEEVNNKVEGMIIAIRNPNSWDPSILGFNELAYWVEPGSRGSSAGYRLLKAYQEHAEEAKKKGDVKYYTISKMVNSPDLNYERHGFRKLEEMWEQ